MEGFFLCERLRQLPWGCSVGRNGNGLTMGREASALPGESFGACCSGGLEWLSVGKSVAFSPESLAVARRPTARNPGSVAAGERGERGKGHRKENNREAEGRACGLKNSNASSNVTFCRKCFHPPIQKKNLSPPQHKPGVGRGKPAAGVVRGGAGGSPCK